MKRGFKVCTCRFTVLFKLILFLGLLFWVFRHPEGLLRIKKFIKGVGDKYSDFKPKNVKIKFETVT